MSKQPIPLNDAILAWIYQEADGNWYFDPPGEQGSYSAHVLRAIADELEKRNPPFANDVPKEIPQQQGPATRTITREFICEAAHTWMRNKRNDYAADEYYGRLGLLYDFVTNFFDGKNIVDFTNEPASTGDSSTRS